MSRLLVYILTFIFVMMGSCSTEKKVAEKPVRSKYTSINSKYIGYYDRVSTRGHVKRKAIEFSKANGKKH
jgi:hypothetical protein